jgi:3-isopropylmalate/(R)-2-methylmalate dehydratase small subunit
MSRHPLVRVEGVAAALLEPNINTDLIAPTVRRTGGKQIESVTDGARRLFGVWRYDDSGLERPDFVLNRPPFRHARFLIAGQNFACGSSRETAALWLRDFGIRCIIAQSFGGIFFDNCFRNGILPMQTSAEMIAVLADEARSGAIFRLDLEQGVVSSASGRSLPIVLPAFRRQLLMTGGDEIAITLGRDAEITSYQLESQAGTPWIWGSFEPPGD